MPTVHEAGVYFGMDEREYHADPALGSSDLRTFMDSPRRYWLGSDMNPNNKYREEFEDTRATLVGTAMHCYLLERRRFFERYVQRPDDKPGATPSDKAQLTKLAKSRLKPGQILLNNDEWDFVTSSAAAIADGLEGTLVGGDHEVSVFWKHEDLDVRCKCRFDVLKPPGIADFKSIATRGRRIDIAAKMAIKYTGLTVQAEHYIEGRRQLPALVKAGQVFLSSAQQGQNLPLGHPHLARLAEGYIERITACAQEKSFAFVFIFIGKEYPESWACILSPGNEMLTTARDHINHALESFCAIRSEYGTKPWPQGWELKELAIEDMPGGAFGWG